MAFAILIDRASHSGKDLRPGLRLVENDALPTRRARCPFEVESQSLGFLLQIVVRPAERLREGGLAALAWSDHGNGRIAGQPLSQFRQELACEHSCKVESNFYSASMPTADPARRDADVTARPA